MIELRAIGGPLEGHMGLGLEGAEEDSHDLQRERIEADNQW